MGGRAALAQRLPQSLQTYAPCLLGVACIWPRGAAQHLHQPPTGPLSYYLCAATVGDLLKAVAEKQGWQPTDSLLRLEGGWVGVAEGWLGLGRWGCAATLLLPLLLPIHSSSHTCQPLARAGFDAPWERLLFRGRELKPEQSLAEQARPAVTVGGGVQAVEGGVVRCRDEPTAAARAQLFSLVPHAHPSTLPAGRGQRRHSDSRAPHADRRRLEGGWAALLVAGACAGDGWPRPLLAGSGCCACARRQTPYTPATPPTDPASGRGGGRLLL